MDAPTNALILFGHGSRDARWAQPFERLRELLRAQLPGVAVELSFLELMEPRLPDLIARLAGDGCESATVVPIFFGQGGHVLRDLPVLVEAARTQYPELKIALAQAVGEDEAVLRAVAAYCAGAMSFSAP